MKKIIIAVSLLCFVACEKHNDSFDVDEEILNVNRTLVEDSFSATLSIIPLESVIKSISNKTERIAYYKRWMDGLMALDISDVGYHHQCNAIRNMRDLVDHNISYGLLTAGFSLEKVWNEKIRMLAWQRKQLERLKPAGPLPKGIKWKGGWEVLDRKVYNEHREWRTCYRSAALGYEYQVQRMEGRQFNFETRNSSEEEKNAIRRNLRKFLGRPIRSEQELLRDFKERRAMEFPYDDIPRNMGPAKFRMPK